ncbi:MAG: hypothetical protein K2I40_07960 [Bifidobacterium castoris]|nr:hypothetical protein [Bifidobacterium castoris]
MATNVSEKSRILRYCDEYVNDLDLVEFKHIMRKIKSMRRGRRNAPSDVRLFPRVDGLVVERISRTGYAIEGGEIRHESLRVNGPDGSFTIDDPTPEEVELLYTYAGYRRALVRVHRWAMANLGYSGGMPSEVPNQSEGADA